MPSVIVPSQVKSSQSQLTLAKFNSTMINTQLIKRRCLLSFNNVATFGIQF